MIGKVNLPPSLANNQIANKIRDYVCKLGPNSGFYSCILFNKNHEYYFMNKSQGFPYIQFDWSMYNLMRISAKTIITSGITFRKQKQIYGIDRGSFGQKEILEIFQSNQDKTPYNLIVYSKKMDNEEIRSIIDQNYFKLIPLSQVLPQNKEHTFKELADRVNDLGLGPTIYENGQTTLGNALKQVKQGQRNFAQLIILSLFHGEMPEKFIGDKYNSQILGRDFEKVWESQKIISTSKQKVQINIELQFVIYERKNKQQMKEIKN